MPRPKNPVPAYRLHKQSGQAVVTVNLGGRRKDFLLGPYNSPASKDEYRRVLDDLAAGRLDRDAPADLTVTELCLRFWRHAEQHYRHPDGAPTTELASFRYAVRALREVAGDLPARAFGPIAFKQVREAMVRLKWARPTVNQGCNRVKRIVRWAVENELLPADRWEALRAVRGLAKGRSPAPEPDPVGPVALHHVAATSPLLGPVVWGMVRLQLLTGMRPGEVCRLRPCDVDRSGGVWLYRPARHKTAWRGVERVVRLGRLAQEVLRAFEPADPADYYFSPRRTVATAAADRAVRRATPRYASHMARNAAKRAAAPKRAPAGHYTTHSYAVAVRRAVERVNAGYVERVNAGYVEAGVEAGEHLPPWTPNQLRHTFASEVRRRYGLEAAQVLLGHARADVTQVYAERDAALAARVAAEIG